MVDRLSAVRSSAPPTPRTGAVRLVATEAGRRVVHKVTERRQTEITKVVAAMPPEHRGAMVQAMQAFADAAGEAQINPTAYAGLALPGWA
ncbi:hypothetical protein GXW83_02485 [Streptacidiphilus sp. PB12-B1b]|uniref:hypothetical protein n=1 Tax=Streptacidiphilus sp. PB12-B1b TaxID=2705012 RepID=UPI0015FB908D|nr:hypothetical protein [Streptacidiphilus sp. PB12-B1b]QMU74808.1 hypothetical protein GXW83_02485 [Streptacidiphilus sp. PB12-B1b]